MQRGDDFLQKYIPLLKKVTLFENIKDADMLSMLKCLGARIHSYKKGEILLMAGDTVSSVGIVLSGQAHVVREDIDGNQMIVTELQTCLGKHLLVLKSNIVRLRWRQLLIVILCGLIIIE